MRISELIAKLDAIKSADGDMPVGFMDGETGKYFTIKTVETRDRKVRKAREYGNMFDDDESLTKRFVGLS